jgi:hypothetical protein
MFFNILNNESIGVNEYLAYTVFFYIFPDFIKK